MKTNRKILFGLLTASSFTAVPLLAAKCDDKNENSQKIHKIMVIRLKNKH